MHVCVCVCVFVCVHAILIQYKTLQFIAFLLKKLSENIRQNVTKSANYKSVEVLCFKLHSYKFVNHCGILYHESETSGRKYTTEYVEIKCQLDATDDFYCRSYCLLNMFRAQLCPSSGA